LRRRDEGENPSPAHRAGAPYHSASLWERPWSRPSRASTLP